MGTLEGVRNGSNCCCSLSQGFYCSASGASVDDLAANVKQIPVSISIVSYVYHFVGVYLVVYLVLYFYVLAMG